MKILIVGGHLAPALSVIEELKNDEVFYIGRKYTFEGDKALSLEYIEISKLNIPFFVINTARLQRKFTRHTIPSFFKFPLGLFQSIKILKTTKPDVVLGFGGYLSLPVILASYLLNIPVVIHEQTLEAGLANKIASRFAKKICISWVSSQKYFPKKKIVLTGNPIRQELIQAKENHSKNKIFSIYVTGGSSGSHAINKLVEENLSDLLTQFSIVHQTGDAKKYEDFKRLKSLESILDENLFKNYKLKKFFTPFEAADQMSKADLVVGRAGINTVTELIYLEKPALLIPLPHGQKNEQYKNAEFLKTLGLAEILNQDHLDNQLFISKINLMRNNINKYKLKEKINIEKSSDKIVEVLKNVSKKKTS